MSRYECREWAAWHDHMPGKTPTLYVTATCQAPQDGWKFELHRHEPQGSNQRDLLLDLIVTEPPSGPDVITDEPARYEEATESEYDTVSILPDGPAGIKVDIVS